MAKRSDKYQESTTVADPSSLTGTVPESFQERTPAEERLIRKLKQRGDVENPFAVANALRARGFFNQRESGQDFDLEALSAEVFQETGVMVSVNDLQDTARDLNPLGIQRTDPQGFSEGAFEVFVADRTDKVALPEGGFRNGYTLPKLQEVVDNFGSAGRVARARGEKHRVPIVIGHDEDQNWLEQSNLPAAGWLKDVWLEGDRLWASFDKLHPQARKWMEQGTFPTRSVELYPDYLGFGSHLRRLAMIGGDIPGQKGLGETVFFNSEAKLPEGVEIVRFSEDTQTTEWVAFNEDAPASLTPEIRTGPGGKERKRMATISEMVESVATDARPVGAIMKALKEKMGDKMPSGSDSFAELDDEQKKAVRSVIGSGGSDNNTEGTEDDKEKAKQADSQTEDSDMPKAKEDKPKTDNNTEAPDNFSELSKRYQRLEAQFNAREQVLDEQKAQIEALENRASNAERRERAKHWDSFCERLATRGKVAGQIKTDTLALLKKLDGVDSFSEGEATGAEAVAAFLEKHLPAVDTTGRRVSAGAEEATDSVDKFSELESKRIAYNKEMGSDLSAEEYARAAGWTVDEFNEAKAQRDRVSSDS